MMYTLLVLLIGALLAALIGAVLFLMSVGFVIAEAAAKKLEDQARLLAAKAASLRTLQVEAPKPEAESAASDVLLGNRPASTG
ncbi:MAG TPA: hypothetical protein VFZ08_07000 [Terriglobia bacterium]|nr:hypothetical protein [Terriglobia bacterium]